MNLAYVKSWKRLRPTTFAVDIVGTCNLRFPSCPIGNISAHVLPKGAMSPEMLQSIVRKAIREYGRVSFHLYNWTEPLLHPRIGECIRVVSEEGVPVFLSTNLNLSKHIEEVAAALPDGVRVSLSGFRQENYGTTHARGDIEAVKTNMSILAEAVKRHGSFTDLTVLFHRYLGNHPDEEEMRRFAEGLGFSFEPIWAYLMPLEKTLAYAEDGKSSDRLTDNDRDIIDRLALPLEAAIETSRKTYTKDCRLRSEQFAIGPNGDVALCCSVYEEPPIGNYLTESAETLQARKYENAMCERCMKHGLHVLSTYGAAMEFESLACARVAAAYPEIELPATIPTKRWLTLAGVAARRIRRVLRVRSLRRASRPASEGRTII